MCSLVMSARAEYSRCKSTQSVQFSADILTRVTDTTVDEELTFIHPDDVESYNKWDSKAFEIQVANHELLGHGSGKLFQEGADGKKNFDPAKVINPLTGKSM